MPSQTCPAAIFTPPRDAGGRRAIRGPSGPKKNKKKKTNNQKPSGGGWGGGVVLGAPPTNSSCDFATFHTEPKFAAATSVSQSFGRSGDRRPGIRAPWVGLMNAVVAPLHSTRTGHQANVDAFAGRRQVRVSLLAEPRRFARRGNVRRFNFSTGPTITRTRCSGLPRRFWRSIRIHPVHPRRRIA